MRHGIRKHLTLVGLENVSSLKAIKHSGRQIVELVARVSTGGGMIAWETPREKIEEMLEP